MSIDINDLTIGQLKEITKMALCGSENKTASEFVGKFCIIRCRDAGVHAGTVKTHSGREVVLSQARRLRYWHAVKGTSLSDVSIHGIQVDSKINAPVAAILLGDMCEILPCTVTAETTIVSQKVDEQ